MPEQLQITPHPRVIHLRREPHTPAVYVGRPTKWGNPYRLTREDQRAGVLECYREYLRYMIESGVLDPRELRGQNLSCFCAPKPCHADILLELANG